MKEEAKSKKDLLKELKSLHRKINRLEKTNRNINISQSEEIRRTEKKYYNIFEESLDGLYISSPEGKILDVNKRGLMIFGYDSKDEIYKLDLAKDIYTNPADRQRILSMVNSQGSAEYEVKYKKKNGEIMDMYCSLVAEKNGSGEIISYRGIVRDISKQKYAEKVLSESEERYHSIFENSISAVFLINQEGSIIAANPEASRIFGWAEEEFRLLKTDAIIDTTDPRLTDALNERAYNGRFKGELTFIKKDGTKFPGLIAANVFLDNEGNEQTSMFIFDITEQKRTEKELLKLNRELRAVSICNQTLLHAVDEQTLINDICRIICEEAGYRLAWVGYAENDPVKTVRPVAWAGLGSGYLASANITWGDNSERGRGPTGITIRTGEITYVQDFTTDPRAVPWRESALEFGFRSNIALPLKGESNNIFGALQIYSSEPNAITSDEIRLLENLTSDLSFGIITLRNRAERKRMETEIKEADERFRLVFDNVFDGISIYSEDPDPFKRKLIECNARYANMAGRTREELLEIGNLQGLMIPLEDTTNNNRLKSLENGTAYQGYSSWIRPDGKENAVEYIGMPITWRGKTYTIGIDRDITERKLAEKKMEKYSQELKELNASKDKLFSIIAHDLKSPFNPLLGISEIIVNNFESLSQEEIKNYNKAIYNALKNEYVLLENLLNWSRLESGQLNFYPEKINLYDKTESVLNLLSGNAKIKEIILFNNTGTNVFVLADPNMLHSILQNLIANSIKFTNKLGLIKIFSAATGNDKIIITVSDNGIGMTNDQINCLFELSDSSTEGTYNEKGTGLGLMICKGMVERHGGTLLVESEFNKGTSISFTLPKAG